MLRKVRLDRFTLSWCIRIRIPRIATIITRSRSAERRIIRRVREGRGCAAVWRAGGDFGRGGVAFAVSIGGMVGGVGVGGVGDYVFFVFLEGVPEVAGGGVGL